MKYILSTIALLAVWFTFYWLGVLIAWHTDPANWHWVLRAVISLCCFLSLLLAVKDVTKQDKQ